MFSIVWDVIAARFAWEVAPFLFLIGGVFAGFVLLIGWSIVSDVIGSFRNKDTKGG